MKSKLSLYIHIPFCVHKCQYCDFLSNDTTPYAMQLRYMDALCNEIRLYLPFADRYEIYSIYIGGGTPSIVDAGLISSLLNVIREVFTVPENAEITIEANPGTVKYTNLLTYHDSGINRISFGLQSTDDALLSTLGRIHTYAEFLESYNSARRAGFDNINVDLMSGLPGQSIHDFVDTLSKITALGPEHISVYSLQVEEGTPLSEDEKLLSLIPDEDTDRQMYAITKKVMDISGYKKYEISNYCKPGYYSRHNVVYWTLREYIGIGIGSASFFKGERFTNLKDINEYLDIMEGSRMDFALRDDKLKFYEEMSSRLRAERTTMYIDRRIEEYMFLGLRMTRGIRRKDFKNRFNKDVYEVYGEIINHYIDMGFMSYDGEFIRLTERGVDVSNVILADFLLTS